MNPVRAAKVAAYALSTAALSSMIVRGAASHRGQPNAREAPFEAPSIDQRSTPPSTDTLWIQGGPFRLRVTVDVNSQLTNAPTMIVALHGDLGGLEQDQFAARAATNSNVIAIGLLRPGYSDGAGHTSDGEKGLTTGDNYNATNTDAIAAAVVALQRRFHARHVVLAGHSGGAAIVANMLARHPDIADAALLVSCPCDVTLWRRHMFEKTKYAGFRGSVETLSPIDQVRGISRNVPVTMMVGTNDDVAPPSLSERYRSAAARSGKHVDLIQLAGKGHEIFLEPAVFRELSKIVAAVNARGRSSSSP